MCYFHTHSRVMITFIFKIFHFLSVIILFIYVLDSEISKFQIYVGKLSKKGPGTRPNHCKIVFIFRSPLETFLWIRACSCMYTSCVTRIFNVTKKQIINTGMCWYIPFTRRPYFYLL